MSYKFNPFTGTLDDVGPNNGNGVPGGSNTQVQFNDGGVFGGDVDFTYNKTSNLLTLGGDINLNDGGSFTTTLQCVTPTANRTISFPDATGTVALVAGSSGQLVYNNAGAYAGVPSSVIGATGDVTLALNGAASTPPLDVTGTWFTGGTSTTTKPQVLIEPAGTTSTAWSTSGTGLGVNAASGFAGRLIDCQVNGSALFNVENSATSETRIFTSLVSVAGNIRQTGGGFSINGNSVGVRDTGTFDFWSGVAASPSVVDLRLFRDAAGILAQRNGTNAQTFRVYNTFTSATNYELGKLEWASNVFRIGTEKGSGGGTARDLSFHTDGTERMRIDSAGRLLVGTTDSSGTPATGSVIQLGNKYVIKAVSGGGISNNAATTFPSSVTTHSLVVDVPIASSVQSFMGTLYVIQQLSDSSKSFLAEYRIKIYNSGSTFVSTLVDSVDDSAPNNASLALSYSSANRQITVTSTWTTATQSGIALSLVGAGGNV